MNIIILGAGTIGVSTAWYLLERGHTVTVVERRSAAALETSFANGAQISVSYCEPWANREAPLKALKWMLSAEAPLLFRPQTPWGPGLEQYRWGLAFLAQCNDAAFERNVQQLVALGAYSHAALKALVAQTGIAYHQHERGIAHYYCDQQALDTAGSAAALMRRYGVDRQIVSTAELLRIEPAYTPFAQHIVGGTYTASDASGDCRVFTQALAQLCAQRGARFVYQHQVQALHVEQGAIKSIAAHAVPEGAGGQFGTESAGAESVGTPAAQPTILHADAVVVAVGAHTAPLLRSVGVRLPIYPGKGYSASLRILHPERAPTVSVIDDAKKIAISRLGDTLRVAGTIEVGGYDLALDTPLARARCAMLTRRIEEVLPGVCDTRSAEDGGDPQYWCGLRPATPTNIPFIGRTPVRGLWVNAGHGTLGWTHSAGSGLALAELMSGHSPELAFRFYGV